jgi:eukaryotic-like serine/threonine-protein kinase
MKSLFRFAMVGLLLVVVALVSAVTAMRFAIHGQEVQVPAIIGVTPAEAERELANAGLQLEIERQYYSQQIPEGRIMIQLPPEGTKVRRGWLVRAAQSMGPQRVAIPDVTKESERAAEWNIRRRGLDVASVAEMQLPGTPGDEVLAQSPPANASGVAAPRTSLLVSVTPGPAAYVMPNFVGQPLGTASHTLQDAGFKLGNVSMAPAPAPQAGANPAVSAPPSPVQPLPSSVIVAQTPAAGQKIAAGATISFEVQ